MKIAFILSGPVIVPSNGVVSQALTWKKGLEQLGHEVNLIDMWQKNDWSSFDIIHFYGFSIYMRDLIIGLSKINPHIVVSPILDPAYSIARLKLYAHWGSLKLNLTNQYQGLFYIKDRIKLFLARSEFEKEYLVKGVGVKTSHCVIVPLAYDMPMSEYTFDKEPFCLHISLLADDRKNVKRLIQAAIKYRFKLILGGKLRNEQEHKLLNSWIGDNTNIEYHGFLSKEKMLSLYTRAKVFALPSTNEGVGIVALGSGSNGVRYCQRLVSVALKSITMEWLKIVDPYSIDEIGKSH